ncbi:MAG: uridine kinase [Chloroflexi bacterium]|nr:uridine kinase [Chloroflexota bacterium]
MANILTIGVAGGTASGKSTISRAILDSVGEENIAHLLHDAYYKPLAQLEAENDGPIERINFDHPDSLDTPLMIDHILQLKGGKAVKVPIYDFVSFDRKPDTQHMEPRPVIMVEGILVLAEPDLRELFDIKIFVDAPADIRFIRRLTRDIEERGRTLESVIDQYLTTVRPMHLAFVEPSMRYADIIVPQGGRNPVAVEMIADRVRGILQHV